MKGMKTKLRSTLVLASSLTLLPGCIAFPPLIQVEHKDSRQDQEIIKRLDAIDQRLSQLEQKMDKK